jgi:glucan 1,3-beta-glucosidase
MRSGFHFGAALLAATGAIGAKVFETRQTCSGPVESNPTAWWRAAIEHNGTTPTAADTTYQYYRTAVQYGADNTGTQDSSDSFNYAINGALYWFPEQRTSMLTHRLIAWNRTGNTVTTMPAYVYVPPGTYRIKKSIQMLVSTYLIGDPIHPSVLRSANTKRIETPY